MRAVEVSIVIPIHLEATNLTALHDARLEIMLEKPQPHAEIIFANDGSTKHASCLIRNLAAQHVRSHIISIIRNSGYQVAITAGLALSRDATTAVVDGNLQGSPELIPELSNMLHEGFGAVYAKRHSRQLPL